MQKYSKQNNSSLRSFVVGMRLSRMTMRGILFSSSLTPKAFLLQFIQIGFSVMQTASMETGCPAGPFFGECSPWLWFYVKVFQVPLQYIFESKSGPSCLSGAFLQHRILENTE